MPARSTRRHIDICALENGILNEIKVQEGQAVKKGDLMFKIVPTLSKAKLDATSAEAKLAQLELEQTKKLAKDKVVPQNELPVLQAKLLRAKAKADLAQRELDFTDIIAPFDGIVGSLHEQLGSLVKEGDMLTTLSDNRVMWVYFNLPERQYLEYMANRPQNEGDTIELVLANQNKFEQPGKIGAIEADFNNTNIALRGF